MTLHGMLQADIEIKAPPSKFHDMFHKRPHHLSKASSDKVQGCELHEGDWGKVGSIICGYYVHDRKPQVVKFVVEGVDEEKNFITFRTIGGDILESYRTFKFTIQAIPKGKGSVVHWTLEYEKLHEKIPDSYGLLEFCVGMSKDIDAHLMEGY